MLHDMMLCDIYSTPLLLMSLNGMDGMVAAIPHSQNLLLSLDIQLTGPLYKNNLIDLVCRIAAIGLSPDFHHLSH